MRVQRLPAGGSELMALDGSVTQSFLGLYGEASSYDILQELMRANDAICEKQSPKTNDGSSHHQQLA